MRVVLTGPHFTPEEQTFLERLCQRIQAAGFDCTLVEAPGTTRPFNLDQAREVFRARLQALQAAEVLVAVLDGPDVCSGIACELGIFYELTRCDPTKKGILGLLTDERPYRRNARQVGEMVNFFTQGSIEKIGRIYSHLEELLAHLRAWEQLKEAV